MTSIDFMELIAGGFVVGFLTATFFYLCTFLVFDLD